MELLQGDHDLLAGRMNDVTIIYEGRGWSTNRNCVGMFHTAVPSAGEYTRLILKEFFKG